MWTEWYVWEEDMSEARARRDYSVLQGEKTTQARNYAGKELHGQGT